MENPKQDKILENLNQSIPFEPPIKGSRGRPRKIYSQIQKLYPLNQKEREVDQENK